MIRLDCTLFWQRDLHPIGLKNTPKLLNGHGLFMKRVRRFNLKNSNILITGGAGYIGSHIAELLVKSQNKIFIYDNLVTGFRKLINKKAIFIKGDIKNKKKLSNIMKKENIDCIIHLAAYLNISEAEKKKKKYFNNNIGGTKNSVNSFKKYSVKINNF